MSNPLSFMLTGEHLSPEQLRLRSLMIDQITHTYRTNKRCCVKVPNWEYMLNSMKFEKLLNRYRKMYGREPTTQS